MTQDMKKHIRIISKTLIVLGYFYLALLVFFGLIALWATKNYVQAGTEEVALLPTLTAGIIISLPLALFAIMHILTGRAFQRGANWARISLWILAILNLGNVPLGTAFGAYAIYVLVNTREEVKIIG